VYPIYFDSTKKLSQGRQVPLSLSIPNPTIAHLSKAVHQLSLLFHLEESKRHPKDSFVFGRIRVDLKSDGCLYRNSIDLGVYYLFMYSLESELLKAIGKVLPQIKIEPSKQSKHEEPPNKTGQGDLVLVPRKKKGKK